VRNDNAEPVSGLFKQDAKELHEFIKTHFDDPTPIDAIVTSPPYANLKDYGDQSEQIGEQDYEDFLVDLKDIFRQCYEVAKDHATLWVVTDTFKRNNRVIRFPFDVADEIENITDYAPGDPCPDECPGTLRRLRDQGVLACTNADCGKTINVAAESWRMETYPPVAASRSPAEYS